MAVRSTARRNGRRSTQKKAALVRIDGVWAIRVFGVAIWCVGVLLTGNLVNSLWGGMEAGRVFLLAAVGQLLLTMGQLRVVRRYFGGLPTFFFALDTVSNVFSLLDIFYIVDFTSTSAFRKSFFSAIFEGDVLLNVVALLVFAVVGYWIATTPEWLIDTGDTRGDD